MFQSIKYRFIYKIYEKKIDLAILCGGKGTRLKNLTRNNSKPLLKFGNNTFLEILINFYKKFNLNKIYLLVGHKSILYKKYHNKMFNFVKVECIVEKDHLVLVGQFHN